MKTNLEARKEAIRRSWTRFGKAGGIFEPLDPINHTFWYDCKITARRICVMLAIAALAWIVPFLLLFFN
jgi:hypothetical protein